MPKSLKRDVFPKVPLHLLPRAGCHHQSGRMYSTSRPTTAGHGHSAALRFSTTGDRLASKDSRNWTTRSGKALTHLDGNGAAHMVDISAKKETTRLATASATLLFSDPETYASLTSQNLAKGDAIAVARIAAINAAKKTSDLIPLAHPSLNITGISVDIEPFSGQERSYVSSTLKYQEEVSKLHSDNGGVTVKASVKCQGKTGVEMEAITAATMGAVTLYDMLKAVDKGMVIIGARVVEKQGGKSGGWVWDEITNALVKNVNSNKQTNSQTSQHEPQLKDTISTPPTSEVDEWNEGLAAEFSIKADGGDENSTRSNTR